MSSLVTLPHKFDSVTQTRIVAYALMLAPFTAFAALMIAYPGMSSDPATSAIALPMLIGIPLLTAVGDFMALKALIKTLKPMKGEMNRQFVTLENSQLPLVGTLCKGGTYGLDKYQALSIVHVQKDRWRISLHPKEGTGAPEVIMMKQGSNGMPFAEALSRELGLSLEGKTK